jgi:hypothetical protein
VKKTAAAFVAFFFLLGVIVGCTDSAGPENETPIGLRNQHDTRVFLICKDIRGHFIEKSLHISESVRCGKKTFRLADFAAMGSTERYIAFPGQENELKKYLQEKGEEER